LRCVPGQIVILGVADDEVGVFIAEVGGVDRLDGRQHDGLGIGVVDSGGRIWVTVDFMQLNNVGAASAPAPAPRVVRPEEVIA